MSDGVWIKDFPAAITICDAEGTILELNEKACKTFNKDGGKDLIGKNVLDCHPERARNKLKDMMKTQTSNCYTIEKGGIKKLVYQSPWYKEGQYMGIAEIVIEIPFEVPHFKRD